MTVISDDITTGVNLDAIEHAYNNGFKGVLLEGASRTGKSWDACAFIIKYMLYFHKQRKKKQITIARDYRKRLTKTIYKTLKQVWQMPLDEDGNNLLPMQHFNKSATSIHFLGHEIEFVGLNDDIATAYGLESDLVYINEAMFVPEDVSDQIEQRLKDFIIYDFNPEANEHYLFKKANNPKFYHFKSTIFDNWEYAPKRSREKILSYWHEQLPAYDVAEKVGMSKEDVDRQIKTNHELATANLQNWKVFGLGLRGVSDAHIFEKVYTYKDLPDLDFDFVNYGLDFGQSPDPTVFNMVAKFENRVYIKEFFRENDLLNGQIADKIKLYNRQEELIVSDVNPKGNWKELRALDCNVYPSRAQTSGMKEYTVTLMQQYEIYIHEDDVDAYVEFKGYKWSKDDKGNFKRNKYGQKVPEDGKDHALDAARYALTYYDDLPRQGEKE